MVMAPQHLAPPPQVLQLRVLLLLRLQVLHHQVVVEVAVKVEAMEEGMIGDALIALKLCTRDRKMWLPNAERRASQSD